RAVPSGPSRRDVDAVQAPVVDDAVPLLPWGGHPAGKEPPGARSLDSDRHGSRVDDAGVLEILTARRIRSPSCFAIGSSLESAFCLSASTRDNAPKRSAIISPA